MHKFKYCPFCKNSLKYRKEYYRCVSCGEKIFINSKPTASLFPLKNSKVLFSKRAINPGKGLYDAVGGFLRPGEHPEKGVIREAKEETGLDVKLTKPLGVFMDVYGKGGFHTLNFYYIAEIINGKIKAHDDVESLHWFPIGKVPEEKIAFKNVGVAYRTLVKWYKNKLKTQKS